MKPIFACEISFRGYFYMSVKALSLEILTEREITPRKFDLRSTAPFINKSVSDVTRRAYSRAMVDFFGFVKGKHPTEVVPADVPDGGD